MKKVFKTMAFTLLGLVLSSNLWAATKTLIVDGSKLTSTATTAATDYTYGDFTITMSDGAKQQASSGDNRFEGTDKAILIGKSGKYIYNKTPFGKKITKFELYANKGASTKVSVGVLFSTTAISAYATGTNTYTATLSTVDKVYDCSSKIPEGAKYFWYQVTNSNNSQVMFRITYEEEEEDPTEPSLSVSPTTIDFGEVYKDAEVEAEDVTVTFANLTTNDVAAAISGSAFSINKTGSFTSGDKITITPSTATLGEYEETLTLSATGVDDQKVTITMNVVEAPAFVTYNKVTDVNDLTEGDVIVLASSTTAYGVAPGSNSYISAVKFENTKNASLKDNVLKAVDAYELTLAKSGTNWTMTGADGIVGTTAAKKMTFGSTESGNVTTWSISIDKDANAAITSTGSYGTIYYNTGSPRFLNYTSSQAAIQIYKKQLAPTNEAVTFAAPEGGSLFIKNGATPIATGATIQDGTILDVTFGMTPAEAYKDVAIKVTNASTSEDVTEKVYDATKKKITMPRYPITVAVTFTKLYKIEAATVTGGTLSWEDANKAKPTYVEAGTYIQALQEEATHYEFKSFDIYKTGETTTKVEDADGLFEMPAYDVTISGTFDEMQCTALPSAPVLGIPSISYADGVTLNWNKLDAASGYVINVWKGTDKIVEDEVIDDVNTLSYKITETMDVNTEYSYSIAGLGDDETYCMLGNPANQSTFTTADYPAVVLTLSENGNTTPVNGKLNTPIELPTTSTQACDGKVFMGWSENTIDGEVGKDQVTLLGTTYTFTEPSVLEKTIYAVYATVVSEGQDSYQKATSLAAGDEVILATETSNAPNTGVTGANSNNKDASVSTTAADWMIFTVEAGSSTGKYKFKNGTSYILATAKNFAMGSNPNEQTLNASSQAIWTNGTDGDYALLINPNQGTPLYRYYKATNSYTKFYVWKVVPGEKTYGNYCTTCQAAVAAPTFSLDEGEYNVAQTLTLTAAEGDIYYTINGGAETLYEEAIALNNRGTFEISAYAKVDDRTSDVVTKTYTLDWPYESLEELVAANVPSGTTVTVSFSNVVINSFNGTKGVNLNVQCEGKNIQIYNSTAFDTQWKVGGTLSKSNLTCTWSRFVQNSEFRCWELMPANWEGFVYNDPVHITSIAISGELDNKDYSDGQTLNPAGLVVTGTYSDSPEHTEVITEGLTWTLPTLTEGATSAKVSVKYTEPVLSTPLTSEEYEVTINAVTPAKTLESIYVADDSEHKDAFFVGRPFSAEGLKVMAKYNIGEDQAIIPTSVTPPAMTSAGTKQVTVSYTEGGVTAEPVTYDITLTYMNLNDLVAATDIEKDDYVYVSFENVKINGFYTNSSGKRYGIYLDVQKSSKDIEIYCNSAEHDATWKQYGTVSATFDNVKWTEYNGTWELTPSSWENVTYTAPNIPVTSMKISPAEVSVGETKTTTLSIVYTPEHATNTGVTWAVAEGSEEFASVDAETGVVTGLKAGTATITATLKADENITATRTVTITATPKCEISYYVKGEVASTQQIAREEEGELTYVPTLTVAGYTFAGWAEAAIAEETATATLISTYTPGAEETAKSVYAVFKRVDDSSPTYQQYAKVTSALTDWTGDYLLVYENEGTAYVWTGVDAASCNVTTTIDGNVISAKPDGAASLTIAAMTDGYSIQVKGGTNDGKYIGKNASGNGMDIGASAYKNTISISENSAVIAGAGGSTMRYNSASDQLRFRYYGSGQKAVQLYKYDAGSVMYTSNPVAKVKVTFNLDGGVGGCGTITVDAGEDVTLCDAAPTKDLYKFDAWSDGVNEYAPSATITHVTEDIELKALWIAKQQYTISFNKAGAAGTTPASITDYEYNEVTLPTQGDLSNPGYIFGGWNDGETTYAGGATFTMPEENVSMTAVWVAKTNDKWYLVTSEEQLVAGKQYAVVANDKGMAMGAMVSGKTYMANVSASFNTDKSMMIAINPSAVILTLGGNATDGWTLSNNGQYLGSETVKNMAWSTEVGDDYKWEITIAGEDEDYEAEIENEVGYLCYNAGSPRFTTYSSVQSKVQLYVLVPAKAIDEEVDASTLDDHADVTVNEGGNLLINAPKTLGDIYVMAGGKVTIQTEATLTVNNFVIRSTMGAGQSGQVIGITETNFKINGNAYFDVTLGDNGNPEKWHAFAVPFNVDAINGVYDLDDNKLTNEVNYAIMDYHGDVRATGAYGWKKFRGIMTPGTFYLMTVDGERTTYRMKMNGGFTASSTTITVNQYASGTDTDAGWNGIANNQLGYSSLGVDVQVLNPTSYTYEVKEASEYNFTVGTPFFYQAEENGSVVLDAANSDKLAYAPRMTAEAKNIAVTLGNDNYTDRLYISATDEATNEYQIGRDLVKMTMTNTPAVPQIFAQAYGTKLCMIDAPMMYDEAVYALNLYAPANGEYTIGAAQVDGYEVFLTQYGSVIWNLSISEATIELTKGNNTEYGLILKATSGHAPTNINTINGQESVQKFLYNSNIYIRHNNKTFNVQGQLVK